MAKARVEAAAAAVAGVQAPADTTCHLRQATSRGVGACPSRSEASYLMPQGRQRRKASRGPPRATDSGRTTHSDTSPQIGGSVVAGSSQPGCARGRRARAQLWTDMSRGSSATKRRWLLRARGRNEARGAVRMEAPTPRSMWRSALRPNRRYQRTANTITSGGNRNPANADGPIWIGGQVRRRFITTARPPERRIGQRNSAVRGGPSASRRRRSRGAGRRPIARRRVRGRGRCRRGRGQGRR